MQEKILVTKKCSLFENLILFLPMQVIIKELIILDYPLLLVWLVVKPVYTTEYKKKNLSKRFLKIRM